jgi:hypothetical protein
MGDADTDTEVGKRAEEEEEAEDDDDVGAVGTYDDYDDDDEEDEDGAGAPGRAAGDAAADEDDAVGDEGDEEDDDDDDEEPLLKYQRLANDTTDILQKDMASCLAVADKFLVARARGAVVSIFFLRCGCVGGVRGWPSCLTHVWVCVADPGHALGCGARAGLERQPRPRVHVAHEHC